MRRLLEILRFTFISPEILIVLLSVYLLIHYPGVLAKVGEQFRPGGDVLRYLPTLPILLVGFSLKYTLKLLQPLGTSSHKVLYQWGEFTSLKDRAIASLLICGIAAGGSITVLMFAGSLDAKILGVLFLGSLGIAVITISTQFLAALKLREILDSHQ